MIQVSVYTFLFFLFLHTCTTRTNSKETSQKSLQRPRRGRLLLQALNVDPRLVVPDKEKERTSTRKSKKAIASAESVLFQRLSQERKDGNCRCTIADSHPPRDKSFFTFAKSLSPAAADLEIRSLATFQDLSLFLRALSQRFKSRRDFEAVQTYLNLFLRVHGELIVSNPELRTDLEAFLPLQRQKSSRLLDSIASCLGTLAFVRDTL